MKSLILFVLFFSPYFLHAQESYVHINQTDIYEFLDELANSKIIELNSCVKPYSRKQIYNSLVEASNKNSSLNKRQQKELEFYLKNYSKEFSENKSNWLNQDLFFYKDSSFSLTINPILGINLYTSRSDTLYHRWNGASLNGTIGKNIGFYANLRDNHESKLLNNSNFLVQREGAMYKKNGVSGDYSEMRGGISYSFKFATIGLIKDHFTWGNSNNGSIIFSGRTPSFTHLKLNLKPTSWLEFNYFHAWLSSGIVDSNKTYNYLYGKRIVYREKFIAANLITIIPVKRLNISFGNSILYSDIPLQAAYLIPIFFYKSIDHTLNGVSNSAGQNSQMFCDISSRQIKNVHLYTSLFIDEISLSKMWNKSKQSNWISWKCGTNLSFIPNVILVAEYTKTNPITYKHFIPSLVYTSNNYNLGHYLGDNAEEQFFAFIWKPIKNFRSSISYTMAKKGTDFVRIPAASGVVGLPFLDSLIWKNEKTEISFQYQIYKQTFVFLGIEFSNPYGNVTKYLPSLYRKKGQIINFGINIGL